MCDDRRSSVSGRGVAASKVVELVEVRDHQLDDLRFVTIVIRIALVVGVDLVSPQGLDYDVSGLSFLSCTS